jgi:hypothetical protein
VTVLKSTPRIGHVVRRYRWSDWRSEAQNFKGFTAERRKELRRKSGFGFQNQAVKGEAQTAKKEQRRQIIDDGGLNGEGNFERLRISRGKVLDHARQQHVQETAADLLAPRAA